MFRLRQILTFVTAGLASAAFAVGVADNGKYRTAAGDREPAPIVENVRIIPPPTGGDLRVRIRTDKPRYHVGDKITVTFGVNRDAYVWIFDTDAAGLTNQVYPNYYDRQNFLHAGKTYEIPDKAYDLQVTGPRGNNKLTIVCVPQDYPFMDEFRTYTYKDPYPASRDGATGLVRRVESFRTEPSALSIQPIRPALREQLWATDDITFYVMDNTASDYRVPRYGVLSTNTYPSNARIYIDGEYYGRTPQNIDRLEIGFHNVRFTKEGYQPYECNVYISGNQTKELDIFLKETPVEPGYNRGAAKPAGDWGFFQPCQ